VITAELKGKQPEQACRLQPWTGGGKFFQIVDGNVPTVHHL
jgi:hypothetical protein